MLQATSTMQRFSMLFVFVIGLIGIACADKTEAHLDRFLNSTTKLKAGKLESIDPFLVPDDPKVADLINMMPFSEVAERLGPHRMTAKINFGLAAPKHRASLREEDLIVLARNGDFRVKVENDDGQGFELIYSTGKLYIRTRHNSFHERSTLSGDHLKWRDAAYGGWAAIYRLFRGQLSFNKAGMVRHHGRDAVRFNVGLSRDKPRIGGTPSQATLPVGVEKYILAVSKTPSAKDRWRDKSTPHSAKGSILVDADCGTLLMANFSGEIVFPTPDGENEIVLSVKANIMTDGFGNPPAIASPAEDKITPPPRRIQVDTHPIDFFFGKGFTSSLGAPAGVAQTKKKPKDKKVTGGPASKP
ncbi:MAG: hypothetical protein JRJ87_05250 [Deltaproteobacteria bacterium]|nr:hypothetical protein [Deltaproteobacteria bacterium]